MAEQTRVLFLIPHIDGGGTERVTALLAQNLSQSRYDIHLGLATQECPPADVPVPQGVMVHGLDAARVRSAALPLLHLVRRLKPALILSNMAHMNFAVLMQRGFYPRRTRVVVRQNGTIFTTLRSRATARVTPMLYRRLYPRADRVICQSQAMADELARELALKPERISVLRNPVDLDGVRMEAQRSAIQPSGYGPHLLAVGRLSHEKGFDMLLRAVNALRAWFPSITLTIAGSGPEEEALHELARALGMTAVVKFLGRVNSPAAYFGAADVFVLSSRHEGMPNALLEAAAAGLPIVATPAAGGVPELLAGRQGVWMADAVSCEALMRALRHALMVLTPEKRFAHEWVEEFALKPAIAAYEALIEEELAMAAG